MPVYIEKRRGQYRPSASMSGRVYHVNAWFPDYMSAYIAIIRKMEGTVNDSA